MSSCSVQRSNTPQHSLYSIRNLRPLNDWWGEIKTTRNEVEKKKPSMKYSVSSLCGDDLVRCCNMKGQCQIVIGVNWGYPTSLATGLRGASRVNYFVCIDLRERHTSKLSTTPFRAALSEVQGPRSYYWTIGICWCVRWAGRESWEVDQLRNIGCEENVDTGYTISP